MSSGWLLFICAQLFWLGVGIYIGASWGSYTHKGRHRGIYTYGNGPQTDKWPYTHKARFSWPNFERHAS